MNRGHKALADTSALYRDNQEFSAAKAENKMNIRPFISELLPYSGQETIKFVEDLALTVVTSFVKTIF
ncbi:hypothetical protein CEDIAZO_02787 [Celerinatantimonas diazotrophica]|nr:hypothetical protein CEDIAZO_02787 [Celerinatantimonas diazotrophica]